MELAIEHFGQQGTAHDAAIAVLLAALMEEFDHDVTDADIEICMRKLQILKVDLKHD